MSGFPDFEQYDALGLADLVRRRPVTPVELLESAIERVEARNPRVNAVVMKLYDLGRRAIAAGLPDGYGPTRNPWDQSRISGGSSGGAAAAVGARMLPTAHASDGVGSIPASPLVRQEARRGGLNASSGSSFDRASQLVQVIVVVPGNHGEKLVDAAPPA